MGPAGTVKNRNFLPFNRSFYSARYCNILILLNFRNFLVSLKKKQRFLARY